MTPNEKAKDLFDKYSNLSRQKDFFGDDIEDRNTKRCALIVVDEMINQLKMASDLNMLYRSDITIFWQEVKQEIIEL